MKGTIFSIVGTLAALVGVVMTPEMPFYGFGVLGAACLCHMIALALDA